MSLSRQLHVRLRPVVAVLVPLVVLFGVAGCTGSAAPTAHTSSSPPVPGTVGSPFAAGASAAPVTGSPTPSSSSSPSHASESLPNVTAPAGLPGLAAPANSSGPTLTGPAPASATAQGAVVKGFPRQVVPVPANFRVASSSVSGQGVHVQATLQASTPDSPTNVQTTYADALARQGFAGSPTATTDGSTAVAYQRGVQSVVVAVRDRVGGGAEVSVLATLLTAG